MHDSYGDGWNGGNLEVHINKLSVGNFAGKNFNSIDTFKICDGDSLVLFYTPGMYENENKFELYDPAYNLVFADGPTPQIGNIFSSIGNCSVSIVPGNNPCTSIAIDTGQCLIADNSGFKGSGINPNCANYQGADIWFTTKVPPSGNLSLETDNGSLMDTGIAVWTDSTCTNLRFLG